MAQRSPIDAQQSTTLDDLRQRIEATDLIPSQEPLLEAIADRFARLAEAGITSAADLQDATKNQQAVAALADASGVEASYLAMLSRAIRGFFPKPRRVKEFDWLRPQLLTHFDAARIKNTQQLRDAMTDDPAGFAEQMDLSDEEQSELRALADLSRVQWTSPTYARALIAAGFDSAAAVAAADPEALCEAVASANEQFSFFGGRVGLRDIARLVAAAGYVASSDTA